MSRAFSIFSLNSSGLVLIAFGFLAGCDESGQFVAMQAVKPNTDTEGAPVAGAEIKTVERDVEAPEVFSADEAGLWDGRPSLGGVWVAHPDVKEPERVIIRNTTNDKFVVGALFRREREIPGPRLQISSDAAEALGMLAGAPVRLNVTALIKEEVPVEPLPGAVEPVDADTVAQAEPIEQTTLDPIATAAAAIDAPAPATPATSIQPKVTPEPVVKTAAASRPTGSSLKKPFIQIGIFSVEANANRTANLMRNAGLVPTVKTFERDGKSFWRVVVGPAQTSAERRNLLEKIKGEGFSDAYAVTN